MRDKPASRYFFRSFFPLPTGFASTTCCKVAYAVLGGPMIMRTCHARAPPEFLANPAGLFIRRATYQFHLGVLRTGVSRTKIPDVDNKEIFVHRLSHCVLPGLDGRFQEATFRCCAFSLFRYGYPSTTVAKKSRPQKRGGRT